MCDIRYVPSFLQKLAIWTDNLQNYRKDMGNGCNFGAGDDGATNDAVWVACLPQPQQQFLRLWEDGVAGHIFDDMLMQAKLSGSAVADLLRRSPIQDRLNNIDGDAEQDADGKPRGAVGANDIAEVSDDDKPEAPSRDKATDIAANKVEDPDGQLKKWVDFARNTVNRRVKLIVDPASASGLSDLIAATPIGQMKGAPGGTGPFVGVNYGCGQNGEASSRPHLRIPAFKDAHCLRAMRAALVAAGGGDEFPDGFLFVQADGKIHGNCAAMQKQLQDSKGKALPKQKKTVYCITTEDSERETKERMSGIATLGTLETINLFTKHTLNAPYKKRLHCGGSNASDTMGPFQRQKKAHLWHVKHGQKAALYGPNIVEAGGKVEGDNVDKDPSPRAKDNVPFTWHSRPTEFWEEMNHSYNVNCWWDMTGSDTVLPMLAIRKQFAYLAVCHTQVHADAMGAELLDQVFRAMQNPEDVLFEKALCDHLKQQFGEADTAIGSNVQTTAQGNDDETGTENQKKAGKTKPKVESLLQRLQKLDDSI